MSQELEKRIIKFRVWDKYEKTMLFLKNNLSHHPVGELMQFIGLQDKNGVDIYEGDIVKVNARLDSCEGLVCFHESSFCFKVPARDKFQNPYRKIGTGWYGIEVVGNIYEDKEHSL